MTTGYDDKNNLHYEPIHSVADPVFRRAIDLLEQSFIVDERPTFNQSLLDNRQYTLSAWYSDQKFVGCLSWWSFDRFTFMEHIAIAPEERNSGLGAAIIRSFLRRGKDALSIGECERATTKVAARRIEFFKRLDFSFNDYDYMQPAYSSIKSPVPMHLISYPRAMTAAECLAYSEIIRTQVYEFHVANAGPAGS
jgi:hypothetical protein